MDWLLLAFSLDSVEHWIAAGGYLVLFGLLFACGLGLPLPEDIPLLAAGVMIANGKMEWALAGLFAWSGIIGGDCVLYHLGKRYGLNITRLPFVGRHLTRGRIERVEHWFDRYGVWVVGVGRLFAGVRGAMVVAAGTIRYSFWKFLIADGAAALVSGGFFVWLGWWLGNALRANMHRIDEVKYYLIIGAVGVGALGAAMLWYSRRRRASLPSKPVDAPV